MTSWINATDPIAIAISAAYGRLDAVADSAAEPTPVLNDQRRTFLFSGLDVDPALMGEYTAEIAAAYVAEIESLGHQVYVKGDEAGRSREDMRDDVRRLTILLLRGLAQVTFLAGGLYGVEHERRAPAGPAPVEPLPPLAADTRVPTIAERHELSRDGVQWVLDLEADRLERIAGTIAALGLGRVAHLMSAAAMALRFELEGGEDIQSDMAIVFRAQHAERARMDEWQIEQLEGLKKLDPHRRAQAIAEIEAIEQRYANERDAISDDDRLRGPDGDLQ